MAWKDWSYVKKGAVIGLMLGGILSVICCVLLFGAPRALTSGESVQSIISAIVIIIISALVLAGVGALIGWIVQKVRQKS